MQQKWDANLIEIPKYSDGSSTYFDGNATIIRQKCYRNETEMWD